MIKIAIEKVRAAVSMADLRLEDENRALQQKVTDHFPAVFDAWVGSGDVDPYGALIDGDDRVFCPTGVTLSDRVRVEGDYTQLGDVRSAYCHTIRMAVERAYGLDPTNEHDKLSF
ncbi:MAG: hypothetical protein WAV90_00355 [Gordonia amarae]